jgi:hypothetical protein
MKIKRYLKFEAVSPIGALSNQPLEDDLPTKSSALIHNVVAVISGNDISKP